MDRGWVLDKRQVRLQAVSPIHTSHYLTNVLGVSKYISNFYRALTVITLNVLGVLVEREVKMF